MNRSEIMEPGMAALQDTLDAMAKDTPPVPESFRKFCFIQYWRMDPADRLRTVLRASPDDPGTGTLQK